MPEGWELSRFASGERPEPPLDLIFELDFASGIHEDGLPQVAAWLEAFEESVFRPLTSRFRQAPGAADESESWGRPGEMYVAMSGRTPGGSFRIPPATQKSRDRLVRDFLAGKLVEMTLEGTVLDAGGHPGGPHVLATVDLAPPWATDMAYVTASVSETLIGGSIPVDFQSMWSKLAIDAAKALGATTGYITFERIGVPQQSAYEEVAGTRWGDGFLACETLLRGYYWGNILSSQHIDALGGMERVRRDAPCEISLDLKTESGSHMYLQLTSDISEISRSQLRELAEFLKPVLAPRDPEAEEPEYEPALVLTE